jgi:hypothetical protein
VSASRSTLSLKCFMPYYDGLPQRPKLRTEVISQSTLQVEIGRKSVYSRYVATRYLTFARVQRARGGGAWRLCDGRELAAAAGTRTAHPRAERQSAATRVWGSVGSARRFSQRAQLTQRQSETLDWPDTGRVLWAAGGAWSACGRVERAAVWQRFPPPPRNGTDYPLAKGSNNRTSNGPRPVRVAF